MVPKVLAPRSSYFSICFLAALLLFGYGNTLTNYFHCDDFLHTAYLYRVFHGEPGLLWQNFSSPWLQDRSFYTFFRPLTELSLALDYLLYQGTALGYHLTALLLHFANAILVYFLARLLLRRSQILTAKETFYPALCASAFFLVLPTHTEAVAWILSRSDLVSTFFYLSTILLFLHKKSWAKTLSLLTLALACLSKETAVTLPLALLLLNAGKDLKTRWKETCPHFLILAFYLGWRALALGTAYGGYSGSLGERMRANFLERWTSSEALYQIFLPFNDELIAQKSPIRLVTRLLYGAFALLLVLNSFIDESFKSKCKLVYPLLIWILLTLLPSLEILGVTDHMSGGRIMYLPAVPISLALVFTVLTLRVKATAINTLYKGLSLLIMVTAIAVAAIAVRSNNQSWIVAGEVTASLRKAIVDEIETLKAGTDKDKRLMIFNVPGQVLGAYTFTIGKTFKGLIAPPFCADLNKSVTALDFHPFWCDWINYQDFLTLKNNPQNYKVLYFEQNSRQLQALPHFDQNIKNQKDSLTPELSGEEFDAAKENKEFYYGVKPKINPAEFQILEITWQDLSPALFCSWNDKASNFDRESLFVKGEEDGLEKVDYLSLCNYKSWLSNSTDIATIKILAAGSKQRAPKLRLLKEETVSPIFRRDTFAEGNLSFTFDGTKIVGAKSIRVELTKPHKYFNHYSDHPRDAKPLSDPLKVWKISTLSGQLNLSVNDLPEKAFYQIRVGALDASGKLLGLYSEAETIEKK